MDDNENNINDSRHASLNKDLSKSKMLSKLAFTKGIVSEYKEPQVLEIENILNSNTIFSSQPNLKEILNQKDIKFTKEYLNLNNLYTSLICYVKIFNAYDRGCLTVSNKNIIVELNKKLIKLKNQSFSDISESKIKNKSTEKELPNYLVNDTIDKILTGKNNEKEKKKK